VSVHYAPTLCKDGWTDGGPVLGGDFWRPKSVGFLMPLRRGCRSSGREGNVAYCSIATLVVRFGAVFAKLLWLFAILSKMSPNFNKKLSYRWQTARRLCTVMLKSPWHKMLPCIPFQAVLSRAALWWMTAIYWPNFSTFTSPSPIWLPQWQGPPWANGFIFGVW